jgi:predicted short-subunit dehydrogenase-like oxidoreductase (DUF2520 family)
MRKKIAIIGSGNVATFIARSLRKANNTITQVYSPDFGHASALAEKIGADPVDQIEHLRDEADLDAYIIAATDDAIPGIAAQLKTIDTVVLHTSGATPKDILASTSPNHGVLYPYQTLRKGDVVDVSSMCMFFDGSNEETTQLIEELAFEITSYAIQVNDEERLKYHLAAVFANNFSNHLFALSEKMLRNFGLDFENLRPVILQTAQSAMIHSPAESQTGPAIRGDEQTMARHLELLNGDEHLKNIYSLLSQSIKEFVPAPVESAEPSEE